MAQGALRKGDRVRVTQSGREGVVLELRRNRPSAIVRFDEGQPPWSDVLLAELEDLTCH